MMQQQLIINKSKIPEIKKIIRSVRNIEAGSKKLKLIGRWQDKNNPNLQLKITPAKFITFVDESKNWNNDWDTSKAIENHKDSLSDDGNYIQVFLDEKEEPFYVQRILLLTKTVLSVEIAKSAGGTGKVKTFVRI